MVPIPPHGLQTHRADIVRVQAADRTGCRWTCPRSGILEMRSLAKGLGAIECGAEST